MRKISYVDNTIGRSRIQMFSIKTQRCHFTSMFVAGLTDYIDFCNHFFLNSLPRNSLKKLITFSLEFLCAKCLKFQLKLIARIPSKLPFIHFFFSEILCRAHNFIYRYECLIFLCDLFLGQSNKHT